jgi:Mn2+/Fe2+ NRAMP family transporter
VPGSPIFLMKMVSKAQMIPKDIGFRRNYVTFYIAIYMSSLNLLEMIDSRYSNSY